MQIRASRLAVLLAIFAATSARAQEPDTTPAFSLASGHIFSITSGGVTPLRVGIVNQMLRAPLKVCSPAGKSSWPESAGSPSS